MTSEKPFEQRLEVVADLRIGHFRGKSGTPASCLRRAGGGPPLERQEGPVESVRYGMARRWGGRRLRGGCALPLLARIAFPAWLSRGLRFADGGPWPWIRCP